MGRREGKGQCEEERWMERVIGKKNVLLARKLNARDQYVIQS
jgi:hypothetical protein